MRDRLQAYLERKWYNRESNSILTLLIDEGYTEAAIFQLVEAGAIDPANSDEPKIERLCLKFIEGYENYVEDSAQCLADVNPAVFVDQETLEYHYVRTKSDFMSTDHIKFHGYWKDWIKQWE